MSLKRMDIESVAVGGGPIASLVVLRSREAADEPGMQLPIRIGSVEASAISMGVSGKPGGRPMTHDLLVNAVRSLGGTIADVRITGVEDTTFFAQLQVVDAQGDVHMLDSRPSDALALAVRCDAPIFADQDVLDVAAMPDFKAVEHQACKRELERFHEFVENVTPDDFGAATPRSDTDQD